MLTSVVVVTARDPARLSGCLAAVTRGAGDVDHEVVVVVNGGAPGLADAAAPHARVVTSEVPLGFAGGANLGAAHSRGELLHVLHDDSLPQPGWLAALVSGLADEPRAASAGSLLLDPAGTEPPMAGSVLWQDALTSACPTVPDRTTVVDYCSSASVLVRREAWAAIGGLDEELYPGQYVDVDLALALQSRGHLTVCVPSSVVHHARGGSASSRQKTFSAARNRARLLAKWGPVVAGQAPRGEDAEAFARAAERTRRRTAEVRALPPVTAELPPPAAVDVRRALERDAAFLRAYADWLLGELERADGIEAEAARMHGEIDRLHEAYAAERAARLALEERVRG